MRTASSFASALTDPPPASTVLLMRADNISKFGRHVDSRSSRFSARWIHVVGVQQNPVLVDRGVDGGEPRARNSRPGLLRAGCRETRDLPAHRASHVPKPRKTWRKPMAREHQYYDRLRNESVTKS